MCLIIYNATGSKIRQGYVEAATENNPNGFGVMWAKDSKVHIVKGLMGLDDIRYALKQLEGIPHVAHWRFRTKGPISKEMCHPFAIHKKEVGDEHDLYMMHNGTLSFLKPGTDESDSSMFARRMRMAITNHANQHEYSPRCSDRLFRKKNLRRIGKQIGMNKLVFLRGDGKFAIVNKSQGFTEDGMWFSNKYSLVGSYRYASKASTTETLSERNAPGTGSKLYVVRRTPKPAFHHDSSRFLLPANNEAATTEEEDNDDHLPGYRYIRSFDRLVQKQLDTFTEAAMTGQPVAIDSDASTSFIENDSTTIASSAELPNPILYLSRYR